MRKIATVMAGAAAFALVSGNAYALCPPNTVGPLASVAAARSASLLAGPSMLPSKLQCPRHRSARM